MTEADATQRNDSASGHRRLGVFVGTWRTEGEVRATDTTPALKIIGTDLYEWLPGESFLVHRVDVRIGDEEEKSTEIIGYDPATDTYPMHSFDAQGVSGVMHATVAGRTWKFSGETMRFSGSFDEEGNTIRGTWEQATSDGGWVPWMDVKLTRVTG